MGSSAHGILDRDQLGAKCAIASWFENEGRLSSGSSYCSSWSSPLTWERWSWMFAIPLVTALTTACHQPAN
jgi:hypothetical protein